jgi:hypothetical protein
MLLLYWFGGGGEGDISSFKGDGTKQSRMLELLCKGDI